jgi:outer membrane protein
MTKLIRILCCSALLALFTTTASQAAGPWSARLRATYLETVDKSDAFTALGINFAENAVAVSDKFIPEIDVDYAFTDTWSAELVLTIPQKHKVTLAGIGQLGTFKHLPPTLLAKYRANPGGAVRPYLGAGLNFTLIWGGNLSVAGVPLALDNFSVGLAAQGGVDIKLDDRWTMNVDVKRAALRTDVSAGGNKLTEARLDPWLYSVGASHAF